MPRNTKTKTLGAKLKAEAEVDVHSAMVEGLKAEVKRLEAERERLEAVVRAEPGLRQQAIDTAVATERLIWLREVEQLKAEVVRTAVAAVAEERSLCLREIDNAFFAATAAKAIRTRAAKRSSATTPVKQ
jgi:hypothetical protein